MCQAKGWIFMVVSLGVPRLLVCDDSFTPIRLRCGFPSESFNKPQTRFHAAATKAIAETAELFNRPAVKTREQLRGTPQ